MLGTTLSGQAWWNLRRRLCWRRQAVHEVVQKNREMMMLHSSLIIFLLANSSVRTLSWPRVGSSVIWERKTLSEYMDLDPVLELGEIKFEPMDAIEVPFPSESYLSNHSKKVVTFASWQYTFGSQESHQDLSFFVSGKSGLITTVLLLKVDKDTPTTCTQNYEYGNTLTFCIRLFQNSTKTQLLRTRSTLEISYFKAFYSYNRRGINHV